MKLYVEDRVVWVGEESERAVGSSGKLRAIDGPSVFVSWGGGSEGWYDVDTEIVSCGVAADRGVEPWASALAAPRPPKEGPYRPVNVLRPGR